MKVNIKNLLDRLTQIDPTMPEFLDTSKKIVEVIKQARKDEANKPPKVLKIKVPKSPKPKICDDCSFILMKNLGEVLPTTQEL